METKNDQPLCACGCGEVIPLRVIIIAESRGQTAKYISRKHLRRVAARSFRAAQKNKKSEVT